MIDIGYADSRLEAICTNRTKAKKVLKDESLFEVLVERLEHIRAFENVSQIPLGGKKDWHPIKGNRKNQWSITIEKPFVICFQPVGNFELDDFGSVKPNTVTALEVVLVGDYH